jgi:hypothetical protein
VEKTKTHFEQVPVAVAKQVAEQELHAIASGLVSCVICGAPVQLEDCNIDEIGRAVHGKCYIGKLAASPRLMPRRSGSSAKPV